jgi:hypothetical protein
VVAQISGIEEQTSMGECDCCDLKEWDATRRRMDLESLRSGRDEAMARCYLVLGIVTPSCSFSYKLTLSQRT